MNSRLHRSRTDKMVGGVCGGLGAYLGIDPTIVRLFFVLLALPGGGIGFFLYLILWAVLPYPDEGTLGSAGTVMTGSGEILGQTRRMGEELRDAAQNPHPQAGLIVGAALIIFGGLYLLDQLNLPFLYWVRPGMLWPVLLIVAGAALVWRRLNENRS